jgi:hypothetical protein
MILQTIYPCLLREDKANQPAELLIDHTVHLEQTEDSFSYATYQLLAILPLFSTIYRQCY